MGMSPDEIDRLHQFRESGQFLNSSLEFQQVTKISDSLLARISVHFKFPDWIAKNDKPINLSKEGSYISIDKLPHKRSDINMASAEDLTAISGIGPVLSKRIVKFRNALGGFLVDDQLLDVYGLDTLVAQRLMKRYTVVRPPKPKQINLQTATTDELSELVYLSHQLASQIIRYRDSLGRLDSLEQLTKIQDFPSEKISRIKLYLTL